MLKTQVCFLLLINLIPVFGIGENNLGSISGCKVSDSSQLVLGLKGNL